MKNIDKARSADSCAHVSHCVSHCHQRIWTAVRTWALHVPTGQSIALQCSYIVPSVWADAGAHWAVLLNNAHTGKCLLVCWCAKWGVHVPPRKGSSPCYGPKKARVKWKWQRKWKWPLNPIMCQSGWVVPSAPRKCCPTRVQRRSCLTHYEIILGFCSIWVVLRNGHRGFYLQLFMASWENKKYDMIDDCFTVMKNMCKDDFLTMLWLRNVALLINGMKG